MMKDLEEKIKSEIKSSTAKGQSHIRSQSQNNTNRSPLGNI
jgi:hypothetical protein